MKNQIKDRIARFAKIQNPETSIFDVSAAKAFGRDAREDGLLFCHNPYCREAALLAWRSWSLGWLGRPTKKQKQACNLPVQ